MNNPERKSNLSLYQFLLAGPQPPHARDPERQGREHQPEHEGKVRDVREHGEAGGKGHVRQVLERPDDAGDDHGRQKGDAHDAANGYGVAFLQGEKIGDGRVGDQAQERGRAQVVDEMGGVKMRQPAQARDVGNIIPLEDGHLAEAGERHHG